ncbi:hypothetical protein DI005_00920 [Prauserella sp. PE36]|uniref:Uncharacterized protein n=1 Tax=Prauserella endophytica TaxID=1592324 RepID=A0ABY2S7J6_9PSEU|nr:MULTISPECIES: DUF6480 family protein [Prauserella]PXY25972.1 hypothetical protein BAY59_20685 [Prauserella coralliicola]RBM24129.1 hypothetical protein DI005_00920 [Prauserella sp. PE36]TKG71855.1 hypothetical protein FCN18_10205 [Prauserella endophytica]
MTTPPPDPDPARTPGLEEGGGVRPGDTPPESGQTSGLSHREPRQSKGMSIAWLVVVVASIVLVAGFFIAYLVIYVNGG